MDIGNRTIREGVGVDMSVQKGCMPWAVKQRKPSRAIPLLKEKHVAVFACAIVSDHVHLLLGRTDIPIDDIVIALKETAVASLLQNGLHPRTALENYPESLTVSASVWAVGYWKVFIDNSEHMHAAIRYINNHCPSQRWGFVTPYI